MAEDKGYLAIVIMAVIAIIVGASLTYIGFFTSVTIGNTADSTLTPASATGNVSFNGKNTTDGELLNITNGAAEYHFEFNATYASPTECLTANCIVVNVFNTNKSLNSATNLTAAINDNATVAAFVTATTVGNSTVLTYITTGAAGNSIALADTGTNFNVTTSTLTGGVDGWSSWSSMQTSVNTSFTLGGIIIMLLGVMGLISVLLKGFGTQGRI